MKVLHSILLSGMLCTGTLYADKPEHAGHEKKEKKHKKHKKENKQFSSQEKSEIESYYSSLPPGLQKKMRRKGELPPGWSQKVRLGEPMPEEYIRRAEPVSDDLRVKLHIDPNTQLLQISNRILRVELGTNRLLGEFQF